MTRKPKQLGMALLEETLVDPGVTHARQDGFSFICGVDEAGRGPLAGPVVVGAVLVHIDDALPGVADSKTLSAARRRALLDPIRASVRAFSVMPASVEDIDALGILAATLAAMRSAVEEAWEKAGKPQMLVIVDGSETIAGLPFRQRAVIDGDRGCKAVAAASILAKERHDDMLVELEARYPGYGFDQHKGYGTADHIEALRRLGPSPVHRRSFEPLRSFLSTGQWAPSTDTVRA